MLKLPFLTATLAAVAVCASAQTPAPLSLTDAVGEALEDHPR